MGSGDITNQLDRIFQLIALLTNEPLSGPQIVERLPTYYEQSGARLVRNDLRMLRTWGFEITSARNPARYILRSNPLTAILADEQVEALALLRSMIDVGHPLQRSFGALLDVLTTQLSPEQRALYQQEPVLHISLKMATSYPAIEPLLKILKFAIKAQRQVQFEYRPLHMRERPVRYQVDPYGIEYRQEHLYLVAAPPSQESVIDFRLDQIEPDSLRSLPTPIARPDRDLYPYVFRYRLSAALANRGVSKRFKDQQVIKTYPNGDVEIEARARSQFYALRGLLRYATNARVVAPPSLVEAMRATLQDMVAMYRE